MYLLILFSYFLYSKVVLAKKKTVKVKERYFYIGKKQRRRKKKFAGELYYFETIEKGVRTV